MRIRATTAAAVLVLLLHSATAWAEAEAETAAPAGAPAAEREAEEPPRRMIPVLGIHIVPSMSIVLPVAGAEAITSPYGLVHPAGSIALSFHLTERFALVTDLEVEGMRGRLELPGADPLTIRFLSYWWHVRARTRVARVGRLSFHLDATLGVVFSREDAHGFRAEGSGVAIGVGPLLEVGLGSWISLSLGVTLESGWIFYGVESPQGDLAPSEYTLGWPRVLVGLGLHGNVIHRRAPRPRAAVEPAPAAEPDAPAPPSVVESPFEGR